MASKTLLFFTCSLLCLSTGYGADVIRISGSDLLGETFIESIERFDQQYAGTVEMEFAGSVPAMANLRRDHTDLAIIAIPDGQVKDEEQYTYVPFAFKVALVVVNRDNPLMEISLRQLAGVYGRSAESNITRWGELGLSGSWAVRSIQTYVLRTDANTHQSLFEYAVLRGASLRPTISYIGSLDRINVMLGNDSAAIALLPSLPKSGTLRTLALSGGSGDNAFAFSPSEENVYYGDYPLRLPFYLVFRNDKKAELREVLRYLLSQDVLEDLKDNAFMIAPENLRRRAILALDN